MEETNKTNEPIRFYELKQYFCNDGRSVNVAQNIDTGEIKYTTPVPVLTKQGLAAGELELTNISSIKNAFEQIETQTKPHLEQLEKTIKELRQQAMLSQPPSPKELKLVT